MNLLAWFNPYRWLMVGGLLTAMTLGYFAWADHIGDVREGQVRAQYAAQAKAADAARAAIAPPIAARQEAAQVKIRTITKTLIEKVNVYVKADACPLPGGFGLLHNAAADGVLPDATRIADAAPVAADIAAETIVKNYGICHENASRLTGLQDWVRAQQALTTP